MLHVLNPVMNNTKWNELRLGMYGLAQTPAWSTLSTNGYKSRPDREWYYHFSIGGYADIIHVDILVENAAHRETVRRVLQHIHVPGEETPEGFRVFGYLQDGQAADYL
ncbi:DUF6678 family protein [Bradyrhizobium sp. 2TAF24]|uniref:DUF6678 family protein n=1 Tax=Bradyrhizobium sp. 2TAF24 TaxID=3233011 RepID=UPI003F928A38